MGKRTKLVLGIAIGAFIVFSGALFGLARFGVIKTGIFADTFGTKITVTVRNQNGSVAAGVPVGLSQGITNVASGFTNTAGVIEFVGNINANTTYRAYTQMAPPAGQQDCNASANVTSGTAGSNRSVTLTLTCNHDEDDGDDDGDQGNCATPCGTNQHCSASNTCINNCTTTSCDAGYTCSATTKECVASGSGTYTLRGSVKSRDGQFLGYASVNNTIYTEWFGPSLGYYTYSGLPVSGSSSQTFTYVKSGYQSKTMRLSDFGIGGAASGVTYSGHVVLDPEPGYSFDTRVFSLIGTAKDQDGSLLSGVSVRVSCNNADQTEASCGESPNIWSTNSQSNLLNYYPNFNDGTSRQFNYEVKNIKRFENYTVFPKLKVEFTKSGYYWDKNNDGQDNDTGAEFLPKPNTIFSPSPNAQAYMVWKNVVMRRAAPTSFTVAGDMFYKINGGEHVRPEATNPIQIKINGAATNINWLSGVPSITYKTNSFSISEQNTIEIIEPPQSNYTIISPSAKVITISKQSLLSALQQNQSISGSIYVLNIELRPKQTVVVFDVKNNSNEKLSGANIKLDQFHVSGDSAFASTSKETDTNGRAVFEVSTSMDSASAEVSKSGYYTKIISYIELDNREEHVEVILSTAPLNSQTIVQGLVANTDGDGIESAIVHLYKDDSIYKQSKYTNQTGNFIFDSAMNRYIGQVSIYAYKDEYLTNENSMTKINVELGKKYEVVLELEENVVTDDTQTPDETFPTQCINRKTLENIECAVEYYIGSSLVDSGTADSAIFWGEAPINKSLTIKVKPEGFDQQRKVIQTKDETQLSEPDKKIYYSQGIFYFDSTSNTTGTLEIKVLDDKSSQPIPEAEVSIIVSSLYNSDTGGPGPFKFLTNNNGIVKLPDAFSNGQFISQLTPAENILKETLLRSYGTNLNLQIQVTADGYDDFEDTLALSSRDVKFEARLSSNNTNSLDVLIINSNMSQLTDMTLDEVKNNVTIARSLNGEFVEVASDPTIVELEDPDGESAIKLTYNNIPVGDYVASFIYKDKAYYNDNGFEPNFVKRRIGASSEVEMKIFYCNTVITNKYSFDQKIYYTLSDPSLKPWFEQNISKFKNASAKLKYVMSRTPDIGPVTIYIDKNNAAGSTDGGLYDCIVDGITCSQISLDKEYVDLLLQSGNSGALDHTIIHEYGHLIDRLYLEKNPNEHKKWQLLFNGLEDQEDSINECIGNRTRDTFYVMDPGRQGGHPWDDETELFASSFAIYFTQHYQFLGSINACTDFSSCENILAYVWQFITEKIGSTSSSDIRQFPPVSGRLGNAAYNFDDIIKGRWRADRYSSLSLSAKAAIQYRRMIAPLFNVASWGNLVSKINQFYYWLRAQNPNESDYSVLTGSVIDQNQKPVASVLVNVGGHYAAITDGSGNFSIPMAPVGRKIIRVIKNNGLYYSIITPKYVEVKETNDPLVIKIRR